MELINNISSSTSSRAHLVKSWTRLGLSVTLRRQERKGMPVASFSWCAVSSSMNRNSLPMAGEKHGIFWVCECGIHELLWWCWLNMWLLCSIPTTLELAPFAAAAVARLSSFLNRIPQALHSDCKNQRD